MKKKLSPKKLPISLIFLLSVFILLTTYATSEMWEESNLGVQDEVWDEKYDNPSDIPPDEIEDYIDQLNPTEIGQLTQDQIEKIPADKIKDVIEHLDVVQINSLDAKQIEKIPDDKLMDAVRKMDESRIQMLDDDQVNQVVKEIDPMNAEDRDMVNKLSADQVKEIEKDNIEAAAYVMDSEHLQMMDKGQVADLFEQLNLGKIPDGPVSFKAEWDADDLDEVIGSFTAEQLDGNLDELGYLISFADVAELEKALAEDGNPVDFGSEIPLGCKIEGSKFSCDDPYACLIKNGQRGYA